MLKSLKIKKEILTDGHPEFKSVYKNLGSVFEIMKNQKKAEEYFSLLEKENIIMIS